MSAKPDPNEKRYWLDDSANVRCLVRAFYVVCALLVAIMFAPKHGPFAIEHWFAAFMAFSAFLACVALVLIAKQLRLASGCGLLGDYDR